MRRVSRYILASMFLAWLLGTAQPAEKSGVAKTQPGNFQVRVSEGYLSVVADEAPVAKILEEIGKQARITVNSRIGPEEKITIRFDQTPLEDAIKQLAKNVTFFYAQDSNNKNPRITKIVVLAERKKGEPALNRPEAPPQSSKKAESPPQPEPFKFEFDPGKFAEKQTPRKQP
jgi:type II secretory pathway component GspD/PulD (secretin)